MGRAGTKRIISSLSETTTAGRRQRTVNKQHKVFVVLLGLLLALAWTALPVSAAPPGQGDDPRAQADALYDEGMNLYDAGEYHVALEELQAALRIFRKISDRSGEGMTLNRFLTERTTRILENIEGELARRGKPASSRHTTDS
jgi:hypothetical protein